MPDTALYPRRHEPPALPLQKLKSRNSILRLTTAQIMKLCSTVFSTLPLTSKYSPQRLLSVFLFPLITYNKQYDAICTVTTVYQFDAICTVTRVPV